MAEKVKNATHRVKRGLRPWFIVSPVSWLMFIVIALFTLLVMRDRFFGSYFSLNDNIVPVYRTSIRFIVVVVVVQCRWDMR